MENMMGKTVGELEIGATFQFADEPTIVYRVVESHPGRVHIEAINTGMTYAPRQVVAASERIA